MTCLNVNAVYITLTEDQALALSAAEEVRDKNII